MANANLWTDAAHYYEEAELNVKAADAYFLAGEARQAADLYMAAGKLQEALKIYVQLQAYRSIAKIHEQQEQWQEAAQAYLASDPPHYEQAANCFVKVQAWTRAASAFQEAGLVNEAVDSWSKSELPRRGAELLRQEGHLAEAAAMFGEIGMLQDAAEIELELGNIREAVNHYRQVGSEERAIQIARDYQRWDIVSEIARESGDYEQEAEAELELASQSPEEDYLHYRAAAHAYVRAAQQHEASDPRLISDEDIARLWDLAARYFDQGMIENKQLIIQAQHEARRLRGWPELVLEVIAERELTIDRWDSLIVGIKNIGYGVARFASVKMLEGEFEGKLDTQEFSSILPGQSEQIRLILKPRSTGSYVPLFIRISYMRPDQEIVERDISTEVPVLGYDSTSATSDSELGRRKLLTLHRDDAFENDNIEKPTIIVQGDIISAGNIDDEAAAEQRQPGSISEVPFTRSYTDNKTGLEMIHLRKLLIKHFDPEELRVLCFDLGLDYEELAGTTKSTKMQDLITYLERRGELPRLLDEVKSQRPNVAWPDFAPTPDTDINDEAVLKEATPADTYTDDKTGLEMIRIPGGEFIYSEDNRPYYLPEFWISKTPVTNMHYSRFVRATGYNSPRHWKGKTIKAKLENHPVTEVSWHDAKAYTDWADTRLPTEEEWEKAARGKDGNIYPWGNEWHEGYCNTEEAGNGSTTPVGYYSPKGDSPYECVDMAGNVWEWTASWYDDKEEYIVMRGGSWKSSPLNSYAAYRNYGRFAVRTDNFGFRVVVRRPPSQ
jgi:formylglycine-generating enzyme required for sulfatase activity